MRQLFIDANILIAVINKEYPLFSNASRVLSLADRKDFDLYTSLACLAISYYFAEKKSGSAVAKKKIKLIVEHLKIANSGYQEVASTLTNSSMYDFEDGLEYYTALNAGCDIIVTENIKDFYFSEIEVTDTASLVKSITKY